MAGVWPTPLPARRCLTTTVSPWLSTDLANPTRFLAYSGRLLPLLWAIAITGLAVGLYLSLFVAPADYQQGETVRIMFIHVPFAWLSMACFGVMAVAALGTLVWRHPLADVAAKSAAPIGAAFTFLALVTGSLWGKPTWGTYWVWDARLTSVLILFIIYLGLIALWQAVEDPGKAARAAAILTLVGTVNLPIIKFSVDWWNTLHQGASVFRAGGPTIDPSHALAASRHGGVDDRPLRRSPRHGHAQRDPPAARARHADRRRRGHDRRRRPCRLHRRRLWSLTVVVLAGLVPLDRPRRAAAEAAARRPRGARRPPALGGGKPA